MSDLITGGTTYRVNPDGATDVNPSHYDFPGGVQVKDISAHLTSFGGQALQYIARSTRLDGMNKGEQVTDLQKAIKLIEWEIERVKEQGEERN